MRAASILILPMSTGVRLRLDPMAGECSNVRQCGSVGLPVCYRCQYRSAADRSKPCGRSSIFRTNDFVLVVAWLLAALRSGGYPLLAISGSRARSEDSSIKASQGAGRSQRGRNQSAAARGTRTDDCRQQWSCARL